MSDTFKSVCIIQFSHFPTFSWANRMSKTGYYLLARNVGYCFYFPQNVMISTDQPCTSFKKINKGCFISELQWDIILFSPFVKEAFI